MEDGILKKTFLFFFWNNTARNLHVVVISKFCYYIRTQILKQEQLKWNTLKSTELSNLQSS